MLVLLLLLQPQPKSVKIDWRSQCPSPSCLRKPAAAEATGGPADADGDADAANEVAGADKQVAEQDSARSAAAEKASAARTGGPEEKDFTSVMFAQGKC